MSALEIATQAWSLAADRAAQTGRRIDKVAENSAYDRMIAAEKAVTA